MSQRDTVETVLNTHSLKAQNSYDRDTCLLAVLSAREAMMRIPDALHEDAYTQAVLASLDDLFNRFHDPDGEFTSGRGVIGALRDDMRAALGG